MDTLLGVGQSAIAVLGTLAAGYLGLRWKAGRDRQQWLLQEKLRVLSKFLQMADRLTVLVILACGVSLGPFEPARLRSQLLTTLDEFDALAGEVTLLCSQEVNEHVFQLRDIWWELGGAVLGTEPLASNAGFDYEKLTDEAGTVGRATRAAARRELGLKTDLPSLRTSACPAGLTPPSGTPAEPPP